ncbi:hypothetical protein VN97_g766 [Penicillium thymicola]|uniref:Uncharacterized protein n=1 Tax=Penicillium thymicola TaxID=293382 RepID=A0AAI9TS71_PENTH|nr:hypothetical protein VN97_g766 [Penicillium thymicola]
MTPRLSVSKLEMIGDMILSKFLNTAQMAEAAECSIINIRVGERATTRVERKQRKQRKQRKYSDLFKLAIQGLDTYPGKKSSACKQASIDASWGIPTILNNILRMKSGRMYTRL